MGAGAGWRPTAAQVASAPLGNLLWLISWHWRSYFLGVWFLGSWLGFALGQSSSIGLPFRRYRWPYSSSRHGMATARTSNLTTHSSGRAARAAKFKRDRKSVCRERV